MLLASKFILLLFTSTVSLADWPKPDPEQVLECYRKAKFRAEFYDYDPHVKYQVENDTLNQCFKDKKIQFND